MPTLSRLIAGLVFAATAYLAGLAFRNAMPETMAFGQFDLINGVVGFLCGWITMTHRSPLGAVDAMGRGLRTSAIIVAWALLIYGIVQMVEKAFRKRYDTPTEAVVDIFALMLKNGMLMLIPSLIVILVAGGVIGGLLTEAVRRRWD
jgi:hypothetical protein